MADSSECADYEDMETNDDEEDDYEYTDDFYDDQHFDGFLESNASKFFTKSPYIFTKHFYRSGC